MKIGYRIRIEKSLTAAQKEVGLAAINNFIKEMTANPFYTKGRGGYHSYFGVNRLGWGWEGLKEQGLLLRRVSKGRRIFAVMQAKHLTMKFNKTNAADYISSTCICPRGHGNSAKWYQNLSGEFVGYDRYVTSALPYSLQAFHTVHEVGDIKG